MRDGLRRETAASCFTKAANALLRPHVDLRNAVIYATVGMVHLSRLPGYAEALERAEALAERVKGR